MSRMSQMTRLATAGLLLLSSISVAAAADSSKSTGTAASMSNSASQSKAKDTLSLTSSEKQRAWSDIHAQATKQEAPDNFVAKVGEKLPSDIKTKPVPVTTASMVPDLRPYQYALLDNNKLLIVNPNDQKIAEVITE